MQLKIYSQLSQEEKDRFFSDLKGIQSESDPAAVNMWADDWEQQKHTLPYKLEKTNMYSGSNGEFYIIYDDEKFVACGGVYRSSFSEFVALAGTRTWIDSNYRNKLIAREILLPEHKLWAMENNCKQVALSFNDYNKRLIVVWKRTRIGESRSPRTERHMFYNDFNELDFPVTIQYTKQWVIYEKLDDSWDFDWSIIQCK